MQAWLTQDSIPSTRTEYVLTLPSSWEWKAQFLGAFLLLAKEQNWEQFGTLTPIEMADEWLDLFLLFENEGVRLMPVGSIMAFAGAVAPDGWLLCNGQAVSRSTYADLFALVDLTYGFGDGSTTFNVPDLRSRVPVGRDATNPFFDFLGEFGGEEEHTLTSGEMPPHTHIQNSHNHTQNSHNHTQDTHNHTQDSHNHTQNTHNHTQNSHSHTLTKQTAHGTTFVDSQNLFALTNLTNSGSQGTDSVVAVNQTTVATNQATTPTNQTTVATNQSATPTNIANTATNQDAGGGDSHNNIQPYLTLNYIIKW